MISEKGIMEKTIRETLINMLKLGMDEKKSPRGRDSLWTKEL